MREVLEWYYQKDFIDLDDSEFFWRMAFDKSFAIRIIESEKNVKNPKRA